MPRIVRLVLRNYAIGFGLALGFTAALLAMNVANLRHLVLSVDGGFLGAFLLFFFSGIVFAGAQAGIAVFLLAENEDCGGPTEAEPAAASDLAAIPVVSRR